MSCSWIGSVMSSRAGSCFTVPGTGRRPARATRARRAPSPCPGRLLIASFFRLDSLQRDHVRRPRPGTRGSSTLRPLTRMCPCATSWRAMDREDAKPRRYTTLSSRRSSIWSRFAPVMPFAARRLGEVVAELALQHAVHPLDLLLLAELDAVALHLRPAAPVLAGGVPAALERALLLEAAVALQEELHAFPAAQPADRSGRPSHCCASYRSTPGAASGAGNRCAESASRP